MNRLSVQPRKSIIDLAEESGLFGINASDLVFESTSNNISYYDFVLSCNSVDNDGGVTMYLAKFDERVNMEEFETCHIPRELFEEGLPQCDLGLMTLGVLVWKHVIAKKRLLCLIRNVDSNYDQAMEALKRATKKFSIQHHVQTIGRRLSTSSNSSYGSTHSYQSEGMRMRVLLCQTRNVVEHIPAQSFKIDDNL
ncbi:unnamed protein product [Caenorhabditis bovis]|uniref:Uncharacterized protein n=1 Tax=Caenorhabditis bovis TaxID=2654633 RepID=A0A8S1ENL0_9PELO|nr:unnamed protein product [Caenorhabditis bovis]